MGSFRGVQVRRCLCVLAAVPELDAVSAVHMAEVRMDGDPARVSGVDPVAMDEVASLRIMKGSPERSKGGVAAPRPAEVGARSPPRRSC